MIEHLSDNLAGRLEEPILIPNDLLRDIFATRTVLDRYDQAQPLHSNISAVHANALYRVVKQHQPQKVLEVGMAHGISSLAIVTALRELDLGGKLISIDPYQFSPAYGGIGVSNIRRAGLEEWHELIEQPDYLALPNLLAQKLQIDVAYIDGMHTFDYTLVDFFYIDKLLRVGGVVGFNDCALPSVRRVMGFVTKHRKYKGIDIGLKPNYLTRSPIKTLQRVITRTSKSDRYFRKLESWEPDWDFYTPF